MTGHDYKCVICKRDYVKISLMLQRKNVHCASREKYPKQHLTESVEIEAGYFKQERMFINRQKQIFKGATR